MGGTYINVKIVENEKLATQCSLNHLIRIKFVVNVLKIIRLYISSVFKMDQICEENTFYSYKYKLYKLNIYNKYV